MMIKYLNIDLYKYLLLSQNVVDCIHYNESYNLKFYDIEKTNLFEYSQQCLSGINSFEFEKVCKDLCMNLKISNINKLIEGDFDFLMRTVDMFEYFLKYKEKSVDYSLKFQQFLNKNKILKDRKLVNFNELQD